jgi:hypothetical protein
MDLIVPGRAIADEIQLSLAPVFLLTAIAGFLTVLTGRLGRAADHARMAAGRLAEGSSGQADAAAFAVLRRRIELLRRAIACTVFAALVVCILIILIFIGEYVDVSLSALIGLLFIIAMMMMMLSFGFFLSEISRSTRDWNPRFWD